MERRGVKREGRLRILAEGARPKGAERPRRNPSLFFSAMWNILFYFLERGGFHARTIIEKKAPPPGK